jgi:hypothetical protein
VINAIRQASTVAAGREGKAKAGNSKKSVLDAKENLVFKPGRVPRAKAAAAMTVNTASAIGAR